MSCIANDFGWENVFKRQVEAHASFTIEDDESAVICNDVLLVFSTSGNSVPTLTLLLKVQMNSAFRRLDYWAGTAGSLQIYAITRLSLMP